MDRKRKFALLFTLVLLIVGLASFLCVYGFSASAGTNTPSNSALPAATPSELLGLDPSFALPEYSAIPTEIRVPMEYSRKVWIERKGYDETRYDRFVATLIDVDTKFPMTGVTLLTFHGTTYGGQLKGYSLEVPDGLAAQFRKRHIYDIILREKTELVGWAETFTIPPAAPALMVP